MSLLEGVPNIVMLQKQTHLILKYIGLFYHKLHTLMTDGIALMEKDVSQKIFIIYILLMYQLNRGNPNGQKIKDTSIGHTLERT